MEKNPILQFLFPQIIKNLFDSFDLLTEIRTITIEEKKKK